MNEEQKTLLGVERCILLQALAESYLLRKTGKHFYEEYPNVKEEYGVLLEEHVKLLKKFLEEDFSARQLDLSLCVEKAGETMLDNKLTDYESKILVRIVDDVLFTYCTVEERKKRFLNK
jgi:hypothetical protein